MVELGFKPGSVWLLKWWSWLDMGFLSCYFQQVGNSLNFRPFNVSRFVFKSEHTKFMRLFIQQTLLTHDYVPDILLGAVETTCNKSWAQQLIVYCMCVCVSMFIYLQNSDNILELLPLELWNLIQCMVMHLGYCNALCGHFGDLSTHITSAIKDAVLRVSAESLYGLLLPQEPLLSHSGN